MYSAHILRLLFPCSNGSASLDWKSKKLKYPMSFVFVRKAQNNWTEGLLGRVESILCIPYSGLGIVQLSLLCWDC